MKILKMTKEDLPQVLSLDQKSFISPWDKGQFLYELEENPYAFLFVAKEDDKVVGLIDFWITFEFGSINQIAVLPEYQKKGIGSSLLREAFKMMLEEGVYEVTLEVRIHNKQAISFYESHGFQTKLIKERYYDNGDDAYFMVRGLIYGQDHFSD